MSLPQKMLQSVRAARWIKEFDSLIKQIGECKSKAEEDRIITAELETLKQRLNDPKLDKARGREYMVRLMYCEMLGHDASWAYIKAVQFCSESSVLTKKAAYLALTQFLDWKSELVLLLVNTLLSDLKSDNFVIVCTALVVTTKLIGPDLVNALYPVVIERLKHPKEHVRKKAVMTLHRFHQLDPTHEGPLAGVDMDKQFRTALCDKDPSVMSAALCALYECVKTNANGYKNLVPSFTSILKQVSEHRLPKSYDYHRFPAPFLQIKLLKILAALGAGDRTASENMYAVIQQTMRRANTSHTIGNAIIYECVRTIITIYPNPTLLGAAADAMSTFLKSNSHNLKYVGVDVLAGIIKINPKYAQEHQLAVIDCLEDPDDTLKLKTLELLYKMTKSNNCEVIVERMMTYLRGASDEHIKRDIVTKVSELAERYAPDPHWFISVMSEVFALGGDYVEAQMAHNLMRLIAEQEDDLHASAVDIYLEALQKPKLPEILLQVICWVLGEYGHLATRSGMRAEDVMDRLVGILHSQKPSDAVRGYMLTALAKMVAQTGCSLTASAEEFVGKASSSCCVDLQQRAHEVQALISSPREVQAGVLPLDASCEEFDEEEMDAMRRLSFLDWFVQQALQRGAAPYVPEEQRLGLNTRAQNDKGKELRFMAYEQPQVAPAPLVTPTPAQQPIDIFGDMGIPPQPQHPTAASTWGQPPPAPQAAATGYGGVAEPALVLRSAGPRKWGPAQFAAPEPARHVTPQPSAAPMPSAAAPRPITVFNSEPAAYAATSSAPAYAAPPPRQPEPPPPRQLTQKEKDAAALFGGASAAASTSRYRKPATTTGAGPSASGHAVRHESPSAAHEASMLGPPVVQHAPAVDLLGDLDAPAAPAAPTHDLLDMLGGPAPAAPPAHAAPAAPLIDFLGGPAQPSVSSAASPLIALDAMPAPAYGMQPMMGTPAGMMPSNGMVPMSMGMPGMPGAAPVNGMMPYMSQPMQGYGYMHPQGGMQQQQPGGVLPVMPLQPQPGAAQPRPPQPRPSATLDPFKDLLS